MKIESFLKKYRIYIIIAIFLLGIFMRIYEIGEESFWLDEIITINFIQHDNILDVMKSVVNINTYSPLIFIFMFFWTKLFGINEVTVRLVPAIFGILSVPLVYLVAKKLTDKELIPLSTTLIFAINRVHIYHSQDTKGYSLMMLLTLASTYYFIEIIRSNKIDYKAYTLLTFFNILGMYTKYLFFFVVFSQAAIFLIYNIKKMKKLSAYLMFSMILILAFIPWGFVILNQDFSDQMDPGDQPKWGLDTNIAAYMIGVFQSYMGIPPKFPWLFFSLFMFGLFAAFKDKKNRPLSANIAFMIFVPIFMVLGVAIITKVPFMSRHFSYALPLYLIMLVYGVFQLKDKRLIALMFLFIVGFQVAADISYYTGYLSADMRTVVERIKENGEEGDLIMVFPGFKVKTLDYYVDNVGPKIKFVTQPLLVSSNSEVMVANLISHQDEINRHDSIFLIVAETRGITPYEKYMQENYIKISEEEFIKARLVEYKQK